MIKRIESAALLVRSVAYGEADLVVTLFTEEIGKVSAIVRGARKSTKRFGGALEPIHELVVVLEDKGRELCVLKEARIGLVRSRIVADLEAMEAAGRALRWVRHFCPMRTHEPGAWASLGDLLANLDAGGESRTRAQLHLATFGLQLLADVGYALELERCVRCGRPCREGRAAGLDPAGGGLVCSRCGGARRTISGEVRASAIAAQRGEIEAIVPDHAPAVLAMIEDAMAAHADFDDKRMT